MTNGWTDIRNADVVLAMGGNPAENHPVGFRFVMEAKRNRNAKLVCVDPRFNRTAAVADRFVQIRAGTDIAFLGGLHQLRAEPDNRYHDEYVRLFTNASFLVSERYAFDEERGLFSGWDDERKAYTDKSSWSYELGPDGFARVDPTLQDPRSVFQVMKRFYARYTPDVVANICGCTRGRLHQGRGDSSPRRTRADRAGTMMYALGWTHHSHSVQLIHTAAMLQLLLGNIGRPGGGLNALRGHANIQGGTDCGMAYHNLPGYIAMPKADHESLDTFLKAVTPKPLRPNVHELLQRTPTGSRSASSRRTTATRPRRRTPSATVSIPRLPQSEGGGYENWSWAFIFDHMYPRRDGRLLQLRDEPGEQRAELAEGGCRAREAEVAGCRRELRAGDRGVLAAGHPGGVGPRSPSRCRPRCSCCRPRTSRRRTARSSTRRDGSSGSGRRWIRREKPSPIRRSSAASS